MSMNPSQDPYRPHEALTFQGRVAPPFRGVMFLVFLVLLVAGHTLASASDKDSAIVEINANNIIGRSDPLLFGQNIITSNGLWNTGTGQIEPTALPLIQAVSPTILRFPGGSVSDIYAWEDGVGVRTAQPIEPTDDSITLDEAPAWQGSRQARFLAPGRGRHGDVFSFQKVEGNRLEGILLAAEQMPAGTMVRTEPRRGQPDWLTNTYGILEHMQVAKALGASVIITVNYGTGLDRSGGISASASLNQKIKRASAFVAFCNGAPTDTRTLGSDDEGHDWKTIGYWAQKRVSRGYPEPFGVKFWEVGNEVYDESEKGFTNVRKYAHDFLLFANAMKSVDPRIHVGAVGLGSPHGKGFADKSDEWNPTLIQIAGTEMDFLVIHPYYPAATRKKADYASRQWFTGIMAGAEQAMTDLAEIRAIIRSGCSRGNSISIALTEYGIWPGDSTEGVDFSNISRAVFDMDLLAGLLNRGSALGINLATGWNLYGSNQTALIRHDWKTTTCTLRPQYFAFEMARKTIQPNIVATKVACSVFRTAQAGNVLPRENIPMLNAVSWKSDDGKSLGTMLINRSLSSSLSCSLNIEGFTPAAATIHVLSGPQPDANNELNPRTVVPQSSQVSNLPRTVTLPPHSVTIVECKAE